ncbi:MAG: tetratricopeptide repeat protein [Deltaproteobacteria bacterium]|nr:tetratricopeptide repeat protein [Deltaproteobacteria bacterium]
MKLRSTLTVFALVSALSVAHRAEAQESALAGLQSASDPAGRLQLGRAQRRAGRYDEALRTLRAAARGASRTDALYETARVYFDRAQSREAQRACGALPRGRGARDPEGMLRHVCMARAHLVWRRAALAEREITAARAIDENHPELRLILADAERISGRLTQAEALYRAAAERLPGRAEPHLGLGQLLEGQGRLDDARAAYQRAVDADPRDPIAALALGRLLRRQGQLENALGLLQRATTDRPAWAEALVELGNVLLSRNALDDALRAFNEAATIRAEQFGVQAGLGLVHLQAGRNAEAETALRRAIEQVPNDAEARMGLAELLGRTSRGEESIEEWNRAIDLMPSDPMPRMRAATQSRSLGMNTLARAYLDRILSDDATHAAALLMRADIAFDENDWRTARQLYQQAIAGHGTIDRARAQARIAEIDAPPRVRRR